MTQSHFRTLLILSFVVGLTGGFVDLIVPSLISESFTSAHEAEGEATSMFRLLLVLAIGIPGLVIYIASLFGLYRFRPWAPRMALVSTALMLVACPLMGVQTQSGWAQSLSYLASYLWGAVLVLACTPPCSAWFAAQGIAIVGEGDA